MRKFLSCMLVLCMVCSMLSVTAFAAYNDDPNHVTGDTAGNTSTAGEEAGDPGDTIGSVDIPVYIETTESQNITHVYALSYDVDEVTFAFHAHTETIWNPETLEYEDTVTGTWDATSQDITVKNYSDVDVKVTPSNTTPVDTGVTVTLSGAIELASAYNGTDAAASAKEGVITVTISGEPVAKYATKTVLTTLTMTVTDNRK